MRVAGIVSFLFLLPPLLPVAISQNGKALDSLIARADSFYISKNYDSALSCNLKALKWYSNNKPDGYQVTRSAAIMLNTGQCYQKKNDMENAHKFMNYSLKMGRANKVDIDIENAFVELNNLHRYISTNNIPFNYPAITATEEISMYFPVTKVEQISKDSIRITIQAGRYDGITDSVVRGGIYSKYNDKDTARPFGLVNCYIRELDNNYCIANATNDSVLVVKVGDIVELKTRVPVSWRNLDVSYSANLAIYFSNNYREPIYNYRYLYYYSDSLTNKEIAAIFKNQILEVAEMLKEDSTKWTGTKGYKGIFAGDNLVESMARTKPEHLNLFMSFVKAYPRKYMGHVYKFSETYATWIINNTPLAVTDVSHYLISLPDSAARQKMAFNLSGDIKNNDLLDKWFNEGMLMANADNIDSAQYMAQLMKDATTALQDKYNEGWASYLAGFVEKKLSNYHTADSLFKLSLQQFSAAGNKEGDGWAISAADNLRKGEKIKMNVQTGHLFPYIIATSSNSRYLATGGIYDKFIKIWDVMLGREIVTFTAHTDEIYSLQYSPNGRYLVSSSEDSTIKIWNAYDYSLIKTITTPKPELSVIFTPDSKQLVAGGKDSLVKFLDISTGNVLKTLKRHKASVTGLAFMPTNDQYLFSCGSDSMIYKWDLETDKMDRWYKEKGKVMGVWISNNGSYMCSLSNDTMMNVWDLENKKFYFKTKVNASKSADGGTFAGPSFSPDSKSIAYALTDDSLAIINLKTSRQRNYGFKKDEYSLYDMAFSHDGNYLVGRLDMGGPLRIYNFSGWDFFNNYSNLSYKDIKTYYTLPLSVQFTHDDNGLVIVHDGVSKIDLRNGATSFLYYGALPFQNNYILLNNENVGIWTGTELPSLKFFDYVNTEFPEKVSLPDSTEKLTHFELSANNRYIFLGGEKGTIAGFNMVTKKRLFSNVYTK